MASSIVGDLRRRRAMLWLACHMLWPGTIAITRGPRGTDLVILDGE